MYLTSDIEKEKEGCFEGFIAKIKSIFKKKEAPKITNSIALKQINLANNEYSSVIDGATRIYGLQGDYVFYSIAEDIDDDDLFDKTSLHSYSTITGEKKVILEDAYDIHNVEDGKVVYSITTPNGLNRELRIHDIEKETDTLIEENVYKFKLVTDDKVFYTIGNDTFQPLYSNTFDGKNRIEVMQNIEKVTEYRTHGEKIPKAGVTWDLKAEWSQKTL